MANVARSLIPQMGDVPRDEAITAGYSHNLVRDVGQYTPTSHKSDWA